MALRLLHAASIQLDVPLSGVGPAPRDLYDLLATATLTAWDRLVEAAVTHDVDAVALTSDTFDAEEGSLAADVALRHGCERLAEREIPVFVTPGSCDPVSAWDEIPYLPDNVTVFESPWDAAVELTDRSRTLGVLLPVSAATDVPPPELERLRAGKKATEPRPFTVGLLWESAGAAVSTPVPPSPRFASLDLLLCSQHAAATPLPLTEGQIHRQGSPQGTSPADTGIRGATLIEIDNVRKLTTRLLPLAPVRRERLTARLDAVRHRDDLYDHMLARVEELPVLPGEQLRLIEWVFDGTSAAWKRLALDEAALAEVAETLTQLTDQPNKLRTLHHAAPMWLGPVDEDQIGELWRDYLNLFDQRVPIDAAELRRLALELRPKQALPEGLWERWLQQLSPQEVARRARGYGRRWFAGA